MSRHSLSSVPPLLIEERAAPMLRSFAQRALQQSPEVARRLLDEIDRADIVDELPEGVVTLGAFVTYRDESTGSIQTLKLVPPHEADPSKMRVSVVSPVGAALIGLKQGQRIDCHVAPGRSMVLEVIRVGPSL